MMTAMLRASWRRAGYLGLLMALVALGLAPPARAGAAGRNLYVATNGADTNDGLTITTPFLTIQKCASVAVAGDTCWIRSGTYRETVRPAASGSAGAPITFAAYGDEAVTVSGLDVLSGWTQHSGAIYKAAMPWTVDNNGGQKNELMPSVNDQIFVDGAPMVEARWPNIAPGRQTVQSRADLARADGVSGLTGNSGTYLDADLAGAGGFWAGGKINFGPGYSIIYTTCGITAKTSAAVSFQCADASWDDDMLRPSAQNNYFLWGKREALDYPGEWFREGAADAGTLYLWTPDGSSPAGHTVEAKRRLYAFDLNRRAHITIQGIDIFAASIQMHDGTWQAENHSDNNKIIAMDGRYLWHAQHLRGFFTLGGNTGIRIRGDNNEIRDSYFADSAGSMVALRGNGNLITNTVFHNMGYAGGSVGVTGGLLNPAGAHNTLTQSTLFNAGRYPIQADEGLDITFNDAYQSHFLISDLGIIYGWGTDGRNARIAYNLVHDGYGERNNDLKYYGTHGIYLDDDTYNYQIYRNVVWNTTAPGIFTFGTNGTALPSHPPASTPSNRFIYQNTVDGELSAAAKSNYNGMPQTLSGTYFRNNISTRLNIASGATSSTNYTGDALHLDRPGRRYPLRSYSPAIDAGMALGSPYADAPMQPVGAPDIGAYEYGRPEFVAGAVLRPQDLAGLTASCAANSANTSATCTVGNLPIGRKLPADFQLRVGAGAVATACVTTMNYSTHFGAGVCAPVDVTGQSGTPPIFIRLGEGAWVDTGGTVDLGPLTVLSVQPAVGRTVGNTPVRVTGRKFDAGQAPNRAPITITNATGATLYSYQVRLELDTAALIAAGKLGHACADLRFSDQYGLLPYWIERGCGTAATRIWVKVAALPAGASTIDMTYGNWTLPPGSDGAATFVFFDDFNDGALGGVWSVGGSGGVTVRETGGAMRIAGTTDDANKYAPIGFSLQTWKLSLPAAYAIDSSWSIAAQPANQGYKAAVGGFGNTLGLFSASGGDRQVGYWDGSQFVAVGDSGLDASTFGPQWISAAFAPSGADVQARHFENGALKATRTVAANALRGYFDYSPSAANVSFDVRFDDVRVRQFAFPEPTASVGAPVAGTLAVTFGGQPCARVAVIDAATLTCLTPPHAVGLVAVTVTNPGGASDDLADAYRYVEFNHLIYSPLLVSGQ